ncbi:MULTISPECIES: hypothetical protein [unclassified Frankia]|uniref:hypothetical protein n=1 Tax=unclassified Frankia TaxID=2632575 RepID=UPI002AD5A1D2|nr:MULTISPECIES: hypothetical protein [unclassified Frankia]
MAASLTPKNWVPTLPGVVTVSRTGDNDAGGAPFSGRVAEQVASRIVEGIQAEGWNVGTRMGSEAELPEGVDP